VIAAEVDLHALARDPRPALLHPLHEFLLCHQLLSPLSAAVAKRRKRIKRDECKICLTCL
jgi:hypothetical protein